MGKREVYLFLNLEQIVCNLNLFSSVENAEIVDSGDLIPTLIFKTLTGWAPCRQCLKPLQLVGQEA